MNAATDNPLVLLEPGQLVSAGNFHGQPLAFALDFLAMAVAELAIISERRIDRLLDPRLSGGLPAFLALDGGLNSGFMLPQYVAASLAQRDRVLAHPASVDSIPTPSGSQEDHVSMGNASGLKAWQVLANVERVLAIELLAGAQASRVPRAARSPASASGPRASTSARSRRASATTARWRATSKRSRASIRDGSFVEAVEAEVGALS